jgi:hypothetical protein
MIVVYMPCMAALDHLNISTDPFQLPIMSLKPNYIAEVVAKMLNDRKGRELPELTDTDYFPFLGVHPHRYYPTISSPH